VLPTQAFLQITGSTTCAARRPLLPAAGARLAVFAGQRWFTERRAAPSSPSPARSAPRRASRACRRASGLAVVCGLVVALVLVCYLLIFAARSCALGADNSLSLAHYGHVSARAQGGA